MQVKKFFKFFGIGAAILIVGVMVAGQIANYSVPVIDHPGKIYSVNGKNMHLYCTGPHDDKQPTVVIIAGLGVQSPLYYDLQEELSKSVRTCTYDRAGNGWSEPNDLPAHAKNMSDDLHQLLQDANIDGPIILAGHSIGGTVSLIYSADHEEQVAGIAFIDSSHYNQINYFGKEFKEISDRQIEELLASFWLIELASKLGIFSMIGVFDTLGFEDHEEVHKTATSFDRWRV